MSDYNDSEEERAFYGENTHKEEANTVKLEHQEEEKTKKRKSASKKKRREKPTAKKLNKTDKQSIALRSEGEQKADQLITRMKGAYEEDQKLLKSGGLANRKIVFCRELEKELRNVYVCEGFLEMGGLTIFEQWLTRPENGIEPSLTLKLRLFKILHEVKIQEQYLTETSNLQIILHKNQKSMMKEIRDLCEAIIMKWGKIAYEDIK